MLTDGCRSCPKTLTFCYHGRPGLLAISWCASRPGVQCSDLPPTDHRQQYSVLTLVASSTCLSAPHANEASGLVAVCVVLTQALPT